MAKKVLSIVLAVAMLLGTFAVASFAGNCYSYTREEAEAEIAEKLWYVDYDADVDWKDEIDRRWLTGTKLYDGSASVAAPQEILEYNLFFWADEIIAEYNAASSNEDYWNLYNKMATPEILDYTYEDGGEMVTECDILYDFAYEYREESKAEFELDIRADKEYAKPGDVITVEVYATSNFRTAEVRGGIFYDKSVLTPLTVEFALTDANWIEQTEADLDYAFDLDENGNVTFDRRDDCWPEYFQTPENLEKYGCSWIYVVGDPTKDFGDYTPGRQFNNELLFTATYEVKEGVADGTAVEFFLPSNVTQTVDDLGAAEYGNGEDASVWYLYRVDYPGFTKETYDLIADYNSFCDQTVTANVETVTIGEEPAPAVKGEIVSIFAEEGYIGDTTTVDVDVTGSPEAIRVVTADGYQVFTRDDAIIEVTENGECWKFEMFVNAAEIACEIYVDYGELGVADPWNFVLTGLVKKDLGIHSIEIPDMYPDAQNGGIITAGKHDVIIKTSTDVVKIQFYAEDGTTYTYTSWSGEGKVDYEDVDGERVWTIPHSFAPFGYNSLVIRTRSAETFFAATGSTLDATVVY